MLDNIFVDEIFLKALKVMPTWAQGFLSSERIVSDLVCGHASKGVGGLLTFKFKYPSLFVRDNIGSLSLYFLLSSNYYPTLCQKGPT